MSKLRLDVAYCRGMSGWILTCLVGLELVLYLAERYQWIGNVPRVPVIMACGLLVLATILFVVRLGMCLAFRWKYEFGIKFLLGAVLVVGATATWLQNDVQMVKRQSEVVRQIANAGHPVSYDFSWYANGSFSANAQPPGPHWLRALLGDKFFADAVSVTGLQHTTYIPAMPKLAYVGLSGTTVDDASFCRIRCLHNLRRLILRDTSVTAVGIGDLRDCPRLEYLEVDNSMVGDSELSEICKLCSLHTLVLDGTRTTDEALRSFDPFEQLSSVAFDESAVTDEGVAILSQLHFVKELYFHSPKISDRGLSYLLRMTQLRALALSGAAITDDGVQNISALSSLESIDLEDTRIGDASVSRLAKLQRLTNVQLNGTNITDLGLEELARLPHLETVFVNRTLVTTAGVQKLRESTGCRISARNLRVAP